MMSAPIGQLNEVKDVYDATGPFATAYLDATRATESGAREVELRWRDLRGQLADAGAGEALLGAMDAAVDADTGVAGRHGLVVVGAGERVVFRAVLPDPPSRPGATLAPLPHLLPYLAAQEAWTPHVVVVADRTGADIAVPRWDARSGAAETVEGAADYPVHRTATADWSEWHFQNRVENTWEANARAVASRVVEQVTATGAQLVVLAGDERARALLRDDLPTRLSSRCDIVDVTAGGRGDGASQQSLREAVRDAVLHHVWAQRRELLEHLRQNLGRREYAAAGLADVIAALQQAQADTVLLSDDPSSTVRVWIGPAATQLSLNRDDLVSQGVSDPQQERFDAALVRAVAGTGARLAVTPNAHQLVADGIAALLRYEERA